MPVKILVVDDELPVERMITQQFRKKIRSNEYEFIFAHNGLEALEKIQNDHQIDLVLTDINMPEMDGLTLLNKLRELDLTLKTVVVSAYGDLKNIKQAMNQGTFDFVTKPIDFQDLEITINKTLEYVQEIREGQRQLQQAQAQLIQHEKMSTLGQLVAGVAHEINNPINYISGNVSIAQGYIIDLIDHLKLYQQLFPNPGAEVENHAAEIELDYLLSDLPKLISSMDAGTERIRQLTISLRNFSRSDNLAKVEFNLHDGVDSTLLILKHRLKGIDNKSAIEVIKNYGDLPSIECYPAQINQVFMNIIANAIDAFEEYDRERSLEEIKAAPNIIKISTQVSPDGESAIVRIEDNGPGMSDEVKNQVFEPFFTTKPVGKGTGLGLSIGRQIVVDKHGGELSCISELGKGTEFVISLPVKKASKVHPS